MCLSKSQGWCVVLEDSRGAMPSAWDWRLVGWGVDVSMEGTWVSACSVPSHHLWVFFSKTQLVGEVPSFILGGLGQGSISWLQHHHYHHHHHHSPFLSCSIEGEYVPVEGDEVTYKVCPIPPKNQKFQAVEVVLTNLAPHTKHETWSGQIIGS